LVGVITFLLGWLLVSGLAIEVAKKAIQKLDVVDIQEPPPPEEPPPPPPPADIPPPPQTRIETPPVSIAPPVTNNVVAAPPPSPPAPPPVVIPPVAPPPSPPPPPARDESRPARPRGNEGSWVTTDDYPPSALREEAQGVTAVRIGVGPDGRVTSCDVASSSGNAALDQAACRNIQRRARFEPALDREGNPTTGTFTKRVRWQIPER
jgi:protein TonB